MQIAILQKHTIMADTWRMEPVSQVAKNLRAIRDLKNFSREELAKLSGVSAAAINSIERGDRWPRSDNLAAIAKALGVSWELVVVWHKLMDDPQALARATRIIADALPDKR